MNIVTSSSVQQALDLLQKEKFDCLVTDLKFSDTSGMEFLEKIQPLVAEKQVSIIIHVEEDISFEEKNVLQKFRRRALCRKNESKKLLMEKIEEFLYSPSSSQIPVSEKDIPDTILRGKKILVVDADMRHAYALAAIFDEKGVKGILVADGAKALDQLARHPDVDLVLMDIMIPVMDGYEVIRRIRQEDRFKKLPIIALTVKVFPDDRKKCIEAGADEHLAKPVDMDKLLSLIKIFLAGEHISLQMTL